MHSSVLMVPRVDPGLFQEVRNAMEYAIQLTESCTAQDQAVHNASDHR